MSLRSSLAQSEIAPHALAHFVPFLNCRFPQIHTGPEGENIEIRLHVREFPGQMWTRLFQGNVAALDLFNDVGGFPELSTDRIAPLLSTNQTHRL